MAWNPFQEQGSPTTEKSHLCTDDCAQMVAKLSFQDQTQAAPCAIEDGGNRPRIHPPLQTMKIVTSGPATPTSGKERVCGVNGSKVIESGVAAATPAQLRANETEAAISSARDLATGSESSAAPSQPCYASKDRKESSSRFSSETEGPRSGANGGRSGGRKHKAGNEIGDEAIAKRQRLVRAGGEAGGGGVDGGAAVAAGGGSSSAMVASGSMVEMLERIHLEVYSNMFLQHQVELDTLKAILKQTGLEGLLKCLQTLEIQAKGHIFKIASELQRLLQEDEQPGVAAGAVVDLTGAD
jgi:hypothetical protein